MAVKMTLRTHNRIIVNIDLNFIFIFIFFFLPLRSRTRWADDLFPETVVGM